MSEPKRLKITGVNYPVNVFKGWSRTYCKNIQKQAMRLAEENAIRWSALFAKPLNKWNAAKEGKGQP